MKKLVLTLDLHDNKDKQRAMKKVSSLPGIDSIAMDMNTRKLTVIGTVDPVDIVSKLRKLWRTDIVSIGPAKEPEKKEEPKKEEAKKDEPKKEEDKKEENKKEAGKEEGKKKEPKKEEAKKEGEPKKEETKKEETKKEEPKKEEKKFDQNQQIAELVNAYRAYNPHMVSHYYVQSAEENPNACVIC